MTKSISPLEAPISWPNFSQMPCRSPSLLFSARVSMKLTTILALSWPPVCFSSSAMISDLSLLESVGAWRIWPSFGSDLRTWPSDARAFDALSSAFDFAAAVYCSKLHISFRLNGSNAPFLLARRLTALRDPNYLTLRSKDNIPMHWRTSHRHRRVQAVVWCLFLLLVQRMFGSRVLFAGLLFWPQRRLAELSLRTSSCLYAPIIAKKAGDRNSRRGEGMANRSRLNWGARGRDQASCSKLLSRIETNARGIRKSSRKTHIDSHMRCNIRTQVFGQGSYCFFLLSVLPEF